MDFDTLNGFKSVTPETRLPIYLVRRFFELLHAGVERVDSANKQWHDASVIERLVLSVGQIPRRPVGGPRDV